MRLLVTGKETDNAFAVVGTGGTFDAPIPFHYHNEAHDVFLCLKGKINVWAEDSARSLGPGDFASVPPVCPPPLLPFNLLMPTQGTIHRYQVDSEHTEFIGLIIPGGWEEFFRFIGEPYSGPLFPTNDKRNPFEVLIPKMIAASEKFDMIPVRSKASFDPQPWDGSETQLPGVCAKGGYFLKADKGERWVVGGTVVRPLATRKETAGRFSIYSIEGSALHAGKGLTQALSFSNTHHAVYTELGAVKLTIDGNEARTTAGETTFVPAACKFTLGFESSWAKLYLFANGGGIGEALASVGVPYKELLVPSDAVAWDEGKLKGLEGELKFVL